MNRVLTTTKPIVDSATHVRINHDKITEFAKNYQPGKVEHWLTHSPYDLAQLNHEERLHFLFIFSSQAFCFWGEPKWTVQWHGNQYDGTWGLIAALARAIEEKQPILDFGYLASMSQERAAELFRANTEIPLLTERWQILQEIGTIMCEHYDGKVSRFVEEANGDALKLVELLSTRFPSFLDTASYNKETVYFDKRTQLFAEVLFHIFPDTFGQLQRIEELTTFADYKLPQILRKLGIFEYDPALGEKIDQKIEIPHNSIEEIEIRASTIWAVKAIKDAISKLADRNVLIFEIDDYLWLTTQTKQASDKPYHRTRTTAY